MPRASEEVRQLKVWAWALGREGLRRGLLACVRWLRHACVRACGIPCAHHSHVFSPSPILPPPPRPPAHPTPPFQHRYLDMAGEDADATAWAMGDDGVARLYADAEALAAGTPLECSVPAYDDFVLDYFSVVNRCLSGPLRSFAHKVRLRR